MKRNIPGRHRKHPIAYTPQSKKGFIAHTIQWSRYNQWSYHYETRAIFRNSFSEEYLSQIDRAAAKFMHFPEVDIFGRSPMPDLFIHADLIHYLQPLALHLLNPWYWTQEGWEVFNEQWMSLPEPQDLWITRCKTVDNLWITCGKGVDNLPTYPHRYAQIAPLMAKLSTYCGKVTNLSTRLSTGQNVGYIVSGSSI